MLLASTIGESTVPVLRSPWSALLLVAASFTVGCSDDTQANATGGTGGALVFIQPEGGASVPPPPPPAAFKQSDVGSYAVGNAVTSVPTGISSAGQMNGAGCDLMVGVVRDFKEIGRAHV